MRVDRSQPVFPLFNPENEGLLPVRTLLYRSIDAGETWSAAQIWEGHANALRANCPVLELDDGKLGHPVEVNKKYEEQLPWPACGRDARSRSRPKHG